MTLWTTDIQYWTRQARKEPCPPLPLGLTCVCVCVCVWCVCAQSCLTLFNPIDYSPPGSLCPWDSPGKNAGVGCHFLFEGIFLSGECIISSVQSCHSKDLKQRTRVTAQSFIWETKDNTPRRQKGRASLEGEAPACLGSLFSYLLSPPPEPALCTLRLA